MRLGAKAKRELEDLLLNPAWELCDQGAYASLKTALEGIRPQSLTSRGQAEYRLLSAYAALSQDWHDYTLTFTLLEEALVTAKKSKATDLVAALTLHLALLAWDVGDMDRMGTTLLDYPAKLAQSTQERILVQALYHELSALHQSLVLESTSEDLFKLARGLLSSQEGESQILGLPIGPTAFASLEVALCVEKDYPLVALAEAKSLNVELLPPLRRAVLFSNCKSAALTAAAKEQDNYPTPEDSSPVEKSVRHLLEEAQSYREKELNFFQELL